MNIVMYSKANCPNCDTAAKLLEAKGLKYTEFDIETDAARRDMLLRQYPEARQLPQIFIGGQRVGGLAGLQQAIKDMGL